MNRADWHRQFYAEQQAGDDAYLAELLGRVDRGVLLEVERSPATLEHDGRGGLEWRERRRPGDLAGIDWPDPRVLPPARREVGLARRCPPATLAAPNMAPGLGVGPLELLTGTATLAGLFMLAVHATAAARLIQHLAGNARRLVNADEPVADGERGELRPAAGAERVA